MFSNCTAYSRRLYELGTNANNGKNEHVCITLKRVPPVVKELDRKMR
jgi:hypothetical protein